MEIVIVVAVGVFLMVAWTLGGWVIVRMGFTRDGDAARHPGHHDDDDARPAHHGPVPVDPASDPNAIWREQMKAATAASGAACSCPAQVSSPDCPIHRWDYS